MAPTSIHSFSTYPNYQNTFSTLSNCYHSNHTSFPTSLSMLSSPALFYSNFGATLISPKDEPYLQPTFCSTLTCFPSPLPSVSTSLNEPHVPVFESSSHLLSSLHSHSESHSSSSTSPTSTSSPSSSSSSSSIFLSTALPESPSSSSSSPSSSSSNECPNLVHLHSVSIPSPTSFSSLDSSSSSPDPSDDFSLTQLPSHSNLSSTSMSSSFHESSLKSVSSASLPLLSPSTSTLVDATISPAPSVSNSCLSSPSSSPSSSSRPNLRSKRLRSLRFASTSLRSKKQPHTFSSSRSSSTKSRSAPKSQLPSSTSLSTNTTPITTTITSPTPCPSPPASFSHSSCKRPYRRHPKPDPSEPMKPFSAYMIFSNQVRDELKDRRYGFSKLAKIVGERWKLMDPKEKLERELHAAKLKNEYQFKLIEYRQTPQFQWYLNYLKDFEVAAALSGRPFIRSRKRLGSAS